MNFPNVRVLPGSHGAGKYVQDNEARSRIRHSRRLTFADCLLWTIAIASAIGLVAMTRLTISLSEILAFP